MNSTKSDEPDLQKNRSSESSFVPLLIAIILLLILIPVAETLPIFFTILATLVLLAGMLAVMRDKAFRALVGTFLLIGLPTRWSAHFFGDQFPLLIPLSHATVGIFFLVLEYFIIFRVITHQEITKQTVIGAICGYMMIGVIFTYFFALLTYLNPASLSIGGRSFAEERAASIEHHNSEVIYFSFITLTTVGYGDIVPAGPFARSLAVIEALAGQLYLAAFVARFVGLLSSPSQTHRET